MSIVNPVIFKSRVSGFLIYAGVFLATCVVVFENLKADLPYNGFDVSNLLVPVSDIYHGGPARDGIPAINAPVFLPVEEVGYMQLSDRVLGLNYRGMVKAYPVKILDYHEIVNDKFQGRSVTVTYCPLCGSGMVFVNKDASKVQSFGVSGLLYNSDMLLYDRQTESLWSQILAKAISGPMAGQALKVLPVVHTDWQTWIGKYPETQVLSTRTGYSRDYQRRPYPGYASNDKLYFPVRHFDKRYHPKEMVVAVQAGGQRKAYPFSELARKPSPLRDSLAGKFINIGYNLSSQTAIVSDDKGRQIPSTNMYWFAWKAFFPQAEVYQYRQNRNK